MSDIPEDLGRKYITAWRAASKVLAETRARELPLIDTVKGLLSLLPAFNASVRERKAVPTSGLIEQQRIFQRARKK